jgi:hypothetical protein
LIEASFGDIRAINQIKITIFLELATKDQYEQALGEYQVYLDEVKSDQRDKAAAYSDQFKLFQVGEHCRFLLSFSFVVFIRLCTLIDGSVYCYLTT